MIVILILFILVSILVYLPKTQAPIFYTTIKLAQIALILLVLALAYLAIDISTDGYWLQDKPTKTATTTKAIKYEYVAPTKAQKAEAITKKGDIQWYDFY